MKNPIAMLNIAMQKPAICQGPSNMRPRFMLNHIKPCRPNVNHEANKEAIRARSVLKSGIDSARTNATNHRLAVIASHEAVATKFRLPMYFVPRKMRTKRYWDATCPRMTPAMIMVGIATPHATLETTVEADPRAGDLTSYPAAQYMTAAAMMYSVVSET